jgi:hypothetical protein
MQSSSYSQLGNAAATGEYGARPSPRGSVLQMQKANKGPWLTRLWSSSPFGERLDAFWRGATFDLPNLQDVHRQGRT